MKLRRFNFVFDEMGNVSMVEVGYQDYNTEPRYDITVQVTKEDITDLSMATLTTDVLTVAKQKIVDLVNS